jgi:alkanesulfonate monooxygenase SsuD/methylene tetrahydromethanopterin reductase-like flavin-dependent oxidoreductase (luciferase family)
MIKRFGTLYAGQVDLDGMGFEGPPVNSRWYDNEHLASVMETAEQLARTMDRLGFDTLWFAEHHFQREGYECIPNILMLAVHLAHLTESLRFGCGFNILPMWHPLRLAEDYAVADILTGGRVRFGVGRGYHTREVETFGAPMLDADANRDLFEEQVEVILKAFMEPSFSHQGKHYTLPPRVPYRGYELAELTLVPRPRTLPIEIWQPIVSASQRGLEFMITHGISGVVGGGAASTLLAGSVVEAWRDALARHGRETALGSGLIIGLSFYIAGTEEQAYDAVCPLLEEYQKMFAPLGFVRPITDEQIVMVANPTTARQAGLPNARDQGWVLGPPERMVEGLLELEDRYPGLEEVMVGQPVGTPRRVLLEQLELFGREVMPAFRERQAARAREQAPVSGSG